MDVFRDVRQLEVDFLQSGAVDFPKFSSKSFL